MRLLFLLLFITSFSFGQTVKIENASFTLKHGDLIFYMDSDTNSLVSVHTITDEEINKLDGDRSDKWHKEKPFGPYKKEPFVNSGYDLGHLTPSNITSYDDTLNYHSFSFFNQAPQLAGFNRGKWSRLEKDVVKMLKSRKTGGIIVTGVIYDTDKVQYLNKSRIKIPIMFYKVVILPNNEVFCWTGSNVNGEVIKTEFNNIVILTKKNKIKILIK